MEIHKNTNRQLNELFNEARHEKPVMDLKEVEKIISDGKFTPASSNKAFRIGINNLIVVSGILVSSFLAYMALKVDTNPPVVEPEQTANVVTTSKPVVLEALPVVTTSAADKK